MTPSEKLFAYAGDFEKTFVDDDWSRLERHFTEDVVYEVVNCPFACRVEGRDAVLAALRKSISGFDRRCDARRLGVRSGPTESGDQVELDWEVTYSLKGAPDLPLLGASLARFRGDRICYLRDSYPDGMGEQVAAWTSEHTPDWDLSYV
jgi:hypothetical protein